MRGMTTSFETLHPRASGSGKFTEKQQTADTISLTSSDAAILASFTVTASIAAVGERARNLTAAEKETFAAEMRSRDETAVDNARRALHVIHQRETDWAVLDGRDTDWDSVNPNRGLAERQFDDEWFAHGAELADDHADALTASYEASLALAYRWKLGREEHPGWNQDAYDTLTRPWAKTIGKAHPDDDFGWTADDHAAAE